MSQVIAITLLSIQVAGCVTARPRAFEPGEIPPELPLVLKSGERLTLYYSVLSSDSSRLDGKLRRRPDRTTSEWRDTSVALSDVSFVQDRRGNEATTIGIVVAAAALTAVVYLLVTDMKKHGCCGN